MGRASENVGCRMLGEFVDDASRDRGEPKPREKRGKDACLKDLVRHIASEMAVPQFHLAEVVERVLVVVGPQIEERVRRQCEDEMTRREQHDDSRFSA